MRLLRSLLVLGVLGLVLPVCAADLNVTAANVVKGSAAQVDSSRLAGEAIVAGETVYLKTSDNKYYRADADDTAATAATAGIALNTAPGAGQPIVICTGGNINPGATVTIGKIYVQSGNAGKIAPVDDLASLDFTTIIGIGTSASNISLILRASGVQVP